MDVSDFIDLHVYVGPGPVPRRYTARDLYEAEADSLNGLGLVNHFYPSTPQIAELDVGDEFELVGSVTLNRYAGGLNPAVVRAVSQTINTRNIIFFPTIHAENFLTQSDWEIPPAWVAEDYTSRPSCEIDPVRIFDRTGRLTTTAMRLLETLTDTGSILGTGYISWREAKQLVETAVEIGVDGILITNPIYSLIDMPLDVQQELASNENVYIEHNYAMHYINDIEIGEIVHHIEHVGTENCVICSDMGQIGNPGPSAGLSTFCDQLLTAGFSKRELREMGVSNPRSLLTRD